LPRGVSARVLSKARLRRFLVSAFDGVPQLAIRLRPWSVMYLRGGARVGSPFTSGVLCLFWHVRGAGFGPRERSKKKDGKGGGRRSGGHDWPGGGPSRARP